MVSLQAIYKKTVNAGNNYARMKLDTCEIIGRVYDVI